MCSPSGRSIAQPPLSYGLVAKEKKSEKKSW
jgi:hypothetical protein